MLNTPPLVYGHNSVFLCYMKIILSGILYNIGFSDRWIAFDTKSVSNDKYHYLYRIIVRLTFRFSFLIRNRRYSKNLTNVDKSTVFEGSYPGVSIPIKYKYIHQKFEYSIVKRHASIIFK